MKTNTKTNILRGVQIVGMYALIFGATATIPAHDDDWHRDRDRGQVRFDIGFNGGHVDNDKQFNGDRDRRNDDRFHRDRDDHDRDWRRDRR